MADSARLSIFLPSLRAGGSERVAVTLANSIAETRRNVEILLARAEGPLMAGVSPDVTITDLGSRTVLTSIPRLAHYLAHSTPLALLAMMDHSSVAALLSVRLAGVRLRIVVSTRGMLSYSARFSPRLGDRLMPVLIRAVYPWSNAIVAVSEGVADDLVRTARVPREKVHVIYNPVVTKELLERSRLPVSHPWFEKGQPPVVLGVGRLTPAKDFPTLIRAFDLVRRERDARLIILGEGEERGRLESLVGSLRSSEDVALPGIEHNPYPYLANAGVFVLSSESEGLPNALIEAMACGTPVVATDCESGPREILDNGRFGTLTPVGDPKELARAIAWTLDNPPQRDLLKRRAMVFSADHATARYLELLEA